jgi:hypothetical protein
MCRKCNEDDKVITHLIWKTEQSAENVITRCGLKVSTWNDDPVNKLTHDISKVSCEKCWVNSR